MGLCKCPLKKVTNLFCFEHRVNVCESCLVQGHSQCIVQTYLKWLQDSDYKPDCQFCSKPLTDAPTVRLLCLDLFHGECLSNYAMSLPPTTAPAAYQCMACQNPIFPDVSNRTPIAEALRRSLSSQQWARPGLGLPIESVPVVSSIQTAMSQPVSITKPPGPPQHTSTPASHLSTGATSDLQYKKEKPKIKPDNIPVGVVSPVTGTFERKGIIDTTEEDERPSVAAFDCDEDKYRRRSVREWLTRWFRLHSSSKARDDPLSVNFRRWVVLLFLGAFVLYTVILMLTRVTIDHSNSDPFVDLKEDTGVQINPK